MEETEGERERYCFKNKILHRKRPRSFSHLLKGHSLFKKTLVDENSVTLLGLLSVKLIFD